MSDEKNQFGLCRDVPDPIKRQIRRECGFGCVCCGFAIATYEHIDPLFTDAREHNPSKMAYLCGGCHDKVSRGFWSKSKVAEARKNPRCIVDGKCHDAFDVSIPSPVVWVGPNKISKIERILIIDDETLLSIDPPDEPGAPFSISGKFFDESGNLLFEIRKNEWIGNIENWDIEPVGPSIIIRTGPGKIALRILAMPPSGIAVERAAMFYRHARFVVNEYEARLVSIKGPGVVIRGREITGIDEDTTFLAAYMDGECKVGGDGGFKIDPAPTDLPKYVRERTPIRPNSKCICASRKIFKDCCGLSANSKLKNGQGPIFTIDGIPMDLALNQGSLNRSEKKRDKRC